jgi:hypothetical protein
MPLKILFNNTSGVRGVRWHSQTGKWLAQIKINYRNLNLGVIRSLDEAIAARKAAEEKYFDPILRAA